MIKNICVYCGSSKGLNDNFSHAAMQLGKTLAEQDIGLVYGGATIGLMGCIADTVMQNGGKVTGIIPKALDKKEVSHEGLTELKVVASMHERKAAMADLADAFIALPGGLGTLEELFEILTWAQLGFHHKPCALLNIDGYFNDLIAFLDHACTQQFVKPLHRNLLLVAETPDSLLEKIHNYQSPLIPAIIQRDET